MPLIESPNERKFARPICVTSQQLRQLDEIIDRYSSRFLTESERLLDEKVEDNFERYYKTEEQVSETKAHIKHKLMTGDRWRVESRTVVISLSRGRELEVKNFTEAAEFPGLDAERPRGFALSYKVFPLSVRVSLGDSSIDNELSVTVKPDDSEVAQAMFGSLCHWSKDVSAPFWQQKWCQARWLFITLLLLFGWIGGIAMLDSSPNQSTNKQQAHKLLDHGIDSTNEKEALALLLAIQSDYKPTPASTGRGHTLA